MEKENLATPSNLKRPRSLFSPENITYSPKRMQQTNTKISELTISQFSNLMQQNMSNLATKDDFEKMQRELDSVKNECQQLRAEIKILCEREKQLQSQVNILERSAKKNNLIFRNLSKSPTQEDLATQIVKFCSEVLNVQISHPRNTTLISNHDRDKHSIILVELCSRAEVLNILKSKTKLKGSKVVIHPDYSRHDRHQNWLLNSLRREIIKAKPNLEVKVRADHLSVNGTDFTWDGDKFIDSNQKNASETMSRAVDQNIERLLEKVLSKAKNNNNKRND